MRCPWIWVRHFLAEAFFEETLPSDFVLGVNWRSEDGFAIVGIHLEALVAESALDALDWDESEIELGVVGCSAPL